MFYSVSFSFSKSKNKFTFYTFKLFFFAIKMIRNLTY